MTEKRLLVVDDEPELAEFVDFVASGLGYQVEVTGGPEEFKRAFERFDPTTIVMDIVMPDVTGVELVKWLIECGCTARVVVASGMNSVYGKELSEIASDNGLSIAFLNKPYRLETLRDVLRVDE